MEVRKKIAVVDFGGQYAHLIASRIRRLGAYTEILSNEESLSNYQKYTGIILSGGPESVYEPDSPTITTRIFELGIPVLGICYGHQLIMKLLGGVVERSGTGEYGPTSLQIHDSGEKFLLKNFIGGERVWMNHADEVVKLPEGFTRTASSKDCGYAVVENTSKKIFGIQFHAEVSHSENGSLLLDNFIQICGASRTWGIDRFLKKKIEEIQKTVKPEQKIFMLVSGGVDSTVSYLLLCKALGAERVFGFLVDTGFMRKGEVLHLQERLALQDIRLTVRDESNLFYESLKGKSDPEEKRKIVGNLFLEVRDRAIKDLDLEHGDWLLGQGTIYPDTIESGGTKHSHTIKTHHNRVEAIQKLIEEGKIIEPIRDLYKDEVRDLGVLLGLEAEWVGRHPFPGPGLVVRMLAVEKKGTSEDQKEIDSYLATQEGLSGKILPVASVGVKGDRRSYANCVVLSDIGTNWKTLDRVATHLSNQFSFINRVVLLPFETDVKKLNFQFTGMQLDKNYSDLLREADYAVESVIRKAGLYDKIWQMPVVLLPIGEKKNEKSIVLRPVESQEAMTANFFPMERFLLQEIKDVVSKISGIRYVFFDLTNKPPGTIEWE
ncbi:glutamine-hydrolyzing GMP synthase [Leptospira borgpetersenii]|uniref:GMP synthase (glutamine-hydrolyzing) n=2 Tax=Leptospira TaxID=171 RepID=A0A0E3B0N5_LEPBO|nr:glutamine-hydrolyzing GMP synthase [Leptospira borgpetersenii]ALO25459.1 GMP synthase (glutamine-hydrolyzing) [Leptospira borgpetersenii serovar Ballum]APY24832.1 GMP synthase (glutamine-hydrolyzing) [Leptospira borgpetersenii str. 4E]KGE23805.1 GMP synthase [Leptospira borgpetersenii serovar Ballum]MBE8159475.1 glutamine-hydrolyzing GMP synthase [Leptospira borgpetersenii serovar Ballum]MBE8163820.1 glutamine-hydrolyzing GMP synthase [Leptospira borgpetersenii serovar Ballum]